VNLTPLGKKIAAKDDSQVRDTKGKNVGGDFDILGYIFLLTVVIVTYVAYPFEGGLVSWGVGELSLSMVGYYGWVTAVSTGLGVFPLILFNNSPSEFWLGVSNAIAGGMMLAASYNLAEEGIVCFFVSPESESYYGYNSLQFTFMGFGIGVIFILLTKVILDMYGGEEAKTELISGGLDTKKVFLIIFVMTLHSLSEGIAIGVSFANGDIRLGKIVAYSLAIHNVPEGLAIAIVLCSRKVSKLRAGLWAIFTSLPQPIMALPAYLFVESFTPFRPAGLGFAAGAMSYVAVFELLKDAVQDASIGVTSIVGLAAFYAMQIAQKAVSEI